MSGEEGLRVLLVANTLPPDDISGVGEQVVQLAAGLEALGHEVRIVGRRERGPGAIKLLFPFTVLAALHRELTGFAPDVVQTHESDGALALLWTATWRAVSHRPCRLVALLQVSYGEELRSVRPLSDGGRVLGRPGAREIGFKLVKAPLQILLGALSAHLADRVLAPSARTASEVARDYRLGGVEVLPNTMGGHRREPEADPSIGDERDYLLFVGRLRVRKGVEVLLESLARLGGEMPPLLVVGEGEHAGRLRRRSERLGLTERVRFLGRRTPGQVRFLMERAGALVVPSIYEGMPLVVLEAMQASLPVIASRVSGIPEVVEEGETGWLVPPEDVAALGAALSAWRRDPQEARRRGAAGRRRVEERYSAERVAGLWARLCVAQEGDSGGESARLA